MTGLGGAVQCEEEMGEVGRKEEGNQVQQPGGPKERRKDQTTKMVGVYREGQLGEGQPSPSEVKERIEKSW